MNLVKYLKLRRQMEQADPNLIREAQELAQIIKAKNTVLVTTDLMWDALIEEAEKRYPGPPELKVLQ